MNFLFENYFLLQIKIRLDWIFQLLKRRYVFLQANYNELKKLK